jgi:hypothetical protein
VRGESVERDRLRENHEREVYERKSYESNKREKRDVNQVTLEREIWLRGICREIEVKIAVDKEMSREIHWKRYSLKSIDQVRDHA